MGQVDDESGGKAVLELCTKLVASALANAESCGIERAAKLIEAEYSDDWRDLPKLVATIRALSNGGKE